MHKALAALLALFSALLLAYALSPLEEGAVFLAPPAPKEARLLFAGDMMFDRSVREYANANGQDYLLSCMDSTLAGPDLVVANLEGPITDDASVSLGAPYESAESFYFTFPPSTAALLLRHHIGAVTLGNNHIENFGQDGVRSTQKYLDEAGVKHFGDPIGNNTVDIDLRGVPITFIAYNEFIPPGEGTADTALVQIADAKTRGRVPIVFSHWGIEYELKAPQRVVDLAHRFVDAGAVAVIGSHPHVVEQSETYKNAPIYYSLGNFVFDQYFSPEVMKGLLVELSVSSSSVRVLREIPTTLTNDRRVCPAQG